MRRIANARGHSAPMRRTRRGSWRPMNRTTSPICRFVPSVIRLLGRWPLIIGSVLRRPGMAAAAAIHDKRFAVRAALENFETAIFLDADSRISAVPRISAFPVGLAVLPVVRKSVADHLSCAVCGVCRPSWIWLAISTGTKRCTQRAGVTRPVTR